ncbi:hypothetical protein MFIFM68171_02625 [Madurella fahalii]|uniref:Heterokaryon incompatibility domain-containing protein n=1 Tax=Madurella fahalii TaxID=1157608 RepID=A0ABQ0G3U9_9PEZI
MPLGPIRVRPPSLDSNPDYAYKPPAQGDVRLLILHPGDTADLFGALVHHSLDGIGPFQAVSYTWGNPAHRCALHTPEGVIKISWSLNSVLVGLRHKDEPLVLWVDAVCIDQANGEEKGAQIRLLPRLFQRATRVLACPGPEH